MECPLQETRRVSRGRFGGGEAVAKRQRGPRSRSEVAADAATPRHRQRAGTWRRCPPAVSVSRGRREAAAPTACGYMAAKSPGGVGVAGASRGRREAPADAARPPRRRRDPAATKLWVLAASWAGFVAVRHARGRAVRSRRPGFGALQPAAGSVGLGGALRLADAPPQRDETGGARCELGRFRRRASPPRQPAGTWRRCPPAVTATRGAGAHARRTRRRSEAAAPTARGHMAAKSPGGDGDASHPRRCVAASHPRRCVAATPPPQASPRRPETTAPPVQLPSTSSTQK